MIRLRHCSSGQHSSGHNDRRLSALTVRRLRCSGASSTVNEATLKELSTKRGTVTPFWWAIKTLFVVRTSPTLLCSRLRRRDVQKARLVGWRNSLRAISITPSLPSCEPV